MECLETPTLVRGDDSVPITDQQVKQLALAAVPSGNELSRAPVERPEVVLDFAEVAGIPGRCAQRAAGGRATPTRIRGMSTVSCLRARDLDIKLRSASTELLDPRIQVGVRPVNDLPKQLRAGLQP